MKTVIVAKAEKAASTIENATIEISGDIPAFLGDGYQQKCHEFYQSQAKIIADALYGSLPGGTLDHLLVELLQRKASLFRVPF